MFIIEKIDEHAKEVLSGKIPNDLKTCTKCNVSNPGFKRHERKYRIFYVIIESLVNTAEILLGRWKCLNCNKTFTYYPDFAIPFKRYVKENIISFSKKYLDEDDSTYSDVVKGDSTSIGYKDDNNRNEVDERMLAATTVWRWLSYFGSLEKPLQKALKLIKSKAPTSKIFRMVWQPGPLKYRSTERKKLLERCMRLFIAEADFKECFESSIFSYNFLHFATKRSLS